MRFHSMIGGLALALLLWSAAAGPVALEAQARGGRWPLQPQPPGGQARIIPFMEGWYENEDGTYSISFGYLNQNRDEAVEIPVGEDNFIEVAEFNGMQPTIFLPGRQRGVFSVTLPAELKNEDVWWTIRNPNGEVTRVPGRTRSNAYELDWNSRPQGSLHPLVSFEPNREEGRGPPGIMAERTETIPVGSPLTLSINARDPSERDPNDHRFGEPIPLRVVWFRYKGAGDVEFTRHESTPVPEEPDSAAAAAAAARAAAGLRTQGPGAETISLPDGHGMARVIVTFSEPGEYVLRAQVDNFRASDSGSGDQCCWTNGYVRVIVTP